MLAIQNSQGIEDAWSNVAMFVPKFIGLLNVEISDRQRHILALSLAGQRGRSARVPGLDLWVTDLRLALRLRTAPLMGPPDDTGDEPFGMACSRLRAALSTER